MNAITRTDRASSIDAAEFVWDTAGPSEANAFILPILLGKLAGLPPRIILDLGCGNGYIAGALSRGGHAVTGLDHSQSGIAIAREQFPYVDFQQHDLAAPLPAAHQARYDCVISVEVVEHLLLPRKLMESACSALRPGGSFILTTPYHGYLKNLALALSGAFDAHWHPLRDYGHVKFFSRATIRELFEEYDLTDISIGTVGRIPALARSMIVTGCKRA